MTIPTLVTPRLDAWVSAISIQAARGATVRVTPCMGYEKTTLNEGD